MDERLQKILSRAGYGSRRKCEELIKAGIVTVNQQTAVIGQKADPAQDDIAVQGTPIPIAEDKVYVILNKPPGVLSTTRAHGGFKTVLDYVEIEDAHVYPVGRLDLHSEGLILLSNDGSLTYRMTHPKFGHDKEYLVELSRKPSLVQLQQWRNGVLIEEDVQTLAAKVELLGDQKKEVWVSIVMREGKKRQIRRVAEVLGLHVKRLKRVRIGPILLGKLKPGEWRHLTRNETARLLKQARKKKG